MLKASACATTLGPRETVWFVDPSQGSTKHMGGGGGGGSRSISISLYTKCQKKTKKRVKKRGKPVISHTHAGIALDWRAGIHTA